MMHVLLESAAPAPRRLGRWTAVSAVVHGSIIAGAIALTLAPEFEPVIVREIEKLVYTRPQPELQPARTEVTAGIAVPGAASVAIPDVTVPRITFPDYIPSPSSSTEFPASRILGERPTNAAPANGAPFGEHQVEQIVLPLSSNPSPSYPSQLRSASVEGEVLARFVVDTLGRVERGSITTPQYTHALFADAVRDWLMRTRYEPATIDGRPVRQMVEQRVGFTLRR